MISIDIDVFNNFPFFPSVTWRPFGRLDKAGFTNRKGALYSVRQRLGDVMASKQRR